MSKKQNDIIDTWVGIFIGALAVLAIKSIFEDDNSKIISKKGRKFLSDDEKMNDLNEKILEFEDENQHKEIYI